MLRSPATAALASAIAATAAAQVSFDDTGPDLVVDTPHYTATFSKTNGRLLALTDDDAGAPVSLGTFWGPWVVRVAPDQWIGGTDFSPTDPSQRFAYAWDGDALTMTYRGAAGASVDVDIVVTPSETQQLRLDLSIVNGAAGHLDIVSFPVALGMDRSAVRSTHLPWIDGVELLDTFWAEGNTLHAEYPALFADFIRFTLPTTSLAMWREQALEDPLQPSAWRGFQHATGDAFRIHKDFNLWIPPGGGWAAPTLVMSIGQSLAADMAAYWTGNRLDTLPRLADKLTPDLLDTLAGAVLLKSGGFSDGFDAFADRLADLPPGNLLHLVGFWPGEFDRNYPDYLPPDPAYGTQQDLIDLVAAAHALGHLVMPYTNPTWWDGNSPTMREMVIEDVAVIDPDGRPRVETYKRGPGYVVCPHHPDIIARQDQTRLEFSQVVPCDLLFEDQVGARGAIPDHNPAAPDPTSYSRGLLELAARSAAVMPVMTEGGYDRMAAHETGFCNSARIDWAPWPAHTYRPFPMAQLWAHDVLWFTSHNLEQAIFTDTVEDLTFYLAHGMSLADHLTPAVDPGWLNVLDRIQKTVVRPTVGRRMTGFEYTAAVAASATTFADGTTILANRSAGTSLDAGDHTIAPNGFLATRDGLVSAGYLTRLNGAALAGPHPHLLLLRRSPGIIAVFKTGGGATALILARPETWTLDAGVRARAVNTRGDAAPATPTLTGGTITLLHGATLDGHPIERYEVFDCDASGLCCLADLNADDATNVLDLALLATRFGASVSPNTGGDLDGDGRVTVFDFAILAADFGCDAR
jgi:hypothetical protein